MDKSQTATMEMRTAMSQTQPEPLADFGKGRLSGPICLENADKHDSMQGMLSLLSCDRKRGGKWIAARGLDNLVD